MKPFFEQYIDYEFSKSMEDELDKIWTVPSSKSKVNFLNESHQKIKNLIQNYGVQDPLKLTTVNLPFESSA